MAGHVTSSLFILPTLFLLLSFSPSQPSPAPKRPQANLEARYLENPQHSLIQQIQEETFHRRVSEDRQKREASDEFSTNTPTPTPNNPAASPSTGRGSNSTGGVVSQGGTTETGPVTTSQALGGDTGGDSSSTSTPDSDQGDDGESGGGLGGLLGPSDPADNSTEEVACSGLNTCQLGYTCENGGTCFYNTSTCTVRCLCPSPYDDPQLYDQRQCTPLPTTTTRTSSGNEGTSVTCSGVNSCIFGYTCENGGTCYYNTATCTMRCLCPPPYNNSELYDQQHCTPLPVTTTTTTTTTDGVTAVTCTGVNACDFGHTCENGGTCYYNITSCTVRCICPPPYDDSDIYDQHHCSPQLSSSAATTTTTTTGDITASTTCTGMNACMFGYTCQNGGTCVYNTTTCTVHCVCPPPYDNPVVYDQQRCTLLPTTTATAMVTTTGGVAGVTCTGVNVCDFGYTCQNGGTCYYNTSTCTVRCLCPHPYNNPLLYDQQHCSPLPTTTTTTITTTTTTTTTTTGDVVITTCSGINVCHFGYACENGGTCFYNSSACTVRCLCPHPYDNPLLYDQQHCSLLPTTTSTTTTTVGVTDAACNGINTCNFGYTCENGGTCYYNTTTCTVRCLCPPPYNNPQLYDQKHCTPLSTTTVSTVTTEHVTDAVCSGINTCNFGYTCENGGTCHYNTTTCTVYCLCPPPYNNPQLYDQKHCTPLLTTTVTTTTSEHVTDAVCSGINMCNFGYSCQNGGTCHYNTTTCTVICLCPPPYNDPQLYDQKHCTPLPTTTSTTTTIAGVTDAVCNGINTCIFGYTCENGGTCYYNTTTCTVYCVCPPPYNDPQLYDQKHCTPLPTTTSTITTTGDVTDAVCTGINTCNFGYTCENGGTCHYNTTTCTVQCLCLPPYDNPQLYDQKKCTPLPTFSTIATTTTTKTMTTTSGTPISSTGSVITAVPCSGLNACDFGYKCENGGTCYYSTTACTVHCRCPPPYNNTRLYDQRTCSPLGTGGGGKSTTTLATIDATPQISPGPSTTLRPLHLRQCRGVTCLHGYCNNVTRPCLCDPGWKGLFCDQGCSRKCANGGRCHFDRSDETEQCMCPRPWMGHNCTELLPDPPGHDQALVNWLSGSFVVGFVVIVILAALFMFFLWRKRLVFALKIVYYFLPYEDNDGRQYDAFVSYVLAEEDERFVHSDLRPKLERDMGFTLCLHQRDFPAGGVISDTILEALEDSRRFILIMTTSYLQNEWAEFEFQRAFHEMLKRKLRIIPVILEDTKTSDSLNPTLRTILQSVTPLEYPGSTAEERKLKKFWKRMQLSMPKKKTTDDTDMTEVVTDNATDVNIEDIVTVKNNNLPPHLLEQADLKMCDEHNKIPNCEISYENGDPNDKMCHGSSMNVRNNRKTSGSRNTTTDVQNNEVTRESILSSTGANVQKNLDANDRMSFGINVPKRFSNTCEAECGNGETATMQGNCNDDPAQLTDVVIIDPETDLIREQTV